jgi:hypothetical protein
MRTLARHFALAAAAAMTLLAADASALDASLGARVGGYGFRQVNADGGMDFFQCRMDGVGLTGTLELPGNFFGEVGVDYYHALAEPVLEGIDRLSLHTSAAVGYRLFPDLIVSPNIQAGVGAEFTRVELQGAEAEALVPVGFMGVGGEVNLGRLKLGAVARVHAMQLPVYDWQSAGTDDAVDMDTEVAGQVLFSMRYML